MAAAADQRKRTGSGADRRWWRRENAYRDLWLLGLSALLYLALTAAAEDRRVRADQTCLLFERQHLRDVRQLKGTYRFLLDPQQGRSTIAQAIRAQLDQVEADALASRAPDYCDAPGLGMPEPNPKIPKRPPALRAEPPLTVPGVR